MINFIYIPELGLERKPNHAGVIVPAQYTYFHITERLIEAVEIDKKSDVAFVHILNATDWKGAEIIKTFRSIGENITDELMMSLIKTDDSTNDIYVHGNCITKIGRVEDYEQEKWRVIRRFFIQLISWKEFSLKPSCRLRKTFESNQTTPIPSK